MKHTLIYLRVSTQYQVKHGTAPNGFSIPAQRRACEALAKPLVVTSTGEFRRPGRDGSSRAEAGLQAAQSRGASDCEPGPLPRALEVHTAGSKTHPIRREISRAPSTTSHRHARHWAVE